MDQGGGWKVKHLGVVYGGASYHHRAINHPKYRDFFSRSIYLPDLERSDLADLDGLLIPARLHRRLLLSARPKLEEFLQRGKTVIALGEQPILYLPGVRWEHRPTNFWWWREPGARSGLVLASPEHSLFRYITLEDATWHYHGVFCPPPGAQTLISTEDGGAVLYLDEASTPGTMVVTSLDPIYHFGSYFMPATERFLDGFLPWATEEVLERRPLPGRRR
jgi:hypothetical protein